MNMVESILSETESAIDRQWRDMEFCYEVMEQHREMEKFINECLIISSGNKKAINEMYILNEAALGDKFKAFFDKIKNFFKKIFDKLGASMTALFSEQKKYMEKYAYIITKCKWQVGDVSDIKDYFVGVPRIIDMIDSNIESGLFGQLKDNGLIGSETKEDPRSINLDNIQVPEKLEIPKVKKEIYEEFLKTPYWTDKNISTETDSNAEPDVDKTFRTYFDGSSDTITVSGDDIDSKFQAIINVTYAGQSYLNKLEKIVTTVNKKMDLISKNSEDELKKMEEDLRKKVKEYKPQQQGEQDSAEKTMTEEEFKKKIEEWKKDTNIYNNGKFKLNIDNKGENEYDSEDAIKQAYISAGYKIGDQAQQNKKKISVATLNGITKDSEGKYKYDGFESTVSRTDLWSKLKATNNYVLDGDESTIQNESYRYLVEAPSFSNGKSSSSDDSVKNKSAAQSLTGTGVNNNNNAAESNKKVSNTVVAKGSTTHTVTGSSATNDTINKKVDEYLAAFVHNRQVRVNALVQVSSSVTRAAFNSFKDANSNFWAIIKAHVQWYLSNPGAEKASENQTSRSRNLDLAGGLTVDKKEPTSSSSETQSQGSNPPAPPAGQNGPAQ